MLCRGRRRRCIIKLAVRPALL
ncbi:hypothetical protein VCCP10303_0309, partial [Vibrio cholerae CP1030(3)]